MTLPLEQLLRYDNITSVVNKAAGGVPNMLPPGFLTSTQQVFGPKFTWDIKESSRKTAPMVGQGNPSASRALQAISQQSATLPRFSTNIVIPGNLLDGLRGLGTSNQQDEGVSWVRYQLEEHGRDFMNTRIAAIYSALKQGAIYFQNDGSGAFELLPTSSGADLTIDLQVPAANKNSLGGLLTDWSASSTDIVEEIQSVLEQAYKQSGQEIRHVFYGPNVRGYITENAQVQDFLRTDTGMANALKQGAIPANFGGDGLQWHPMRRGFFEDSSGTNQDWFTGDEVIFTPDPSPAWYTLAEGTERVPTNLNVTDPSASVGAPIRGMGAYAYQQPDPLSYKVVGFDSFLPVFTVPSAIFIGDCTN